MNRHAAAGFTVLLFLIGTCAFGQGLPLPFQKLTKADGLPQSSISALVQDDQGYIWIGTQDGLAKYDGYDFKVFRHEKGNGHSLSHNFIWDITKDDEGLLWITTLGNGMTRLHPKKEEFTQYLHSNVPGEGLSHHNTFSTLRVDSVLYIGTNASLDKLNLNTGEILTYVPGAEWGKDSVTSVIRSIAKLQNDNTIWMSTTLGLAAFDPQRETFQYFRSSPFGTESSLRNIFTLSAEGDALLITTTERVLSIDFTKEEEHLIADARVYDLPGSARFHGYLKGRGEFDYIYTTHGLIRINRVTGSTIHHKQEPENPESLSHNYVISVLESRDGALWIGTRNGITTSRYFDAGFTRYGDAELPGYSLQGKGVNALIAKDDTTLLVGTYIGVEAINLKTGKIDLIDAYRDGSIPEESHYTLSMCEDGEGTVWVGARNGGLIRLKSDDVGTYKARSYPLGGASIQFIHDEDSLLWLGSSGMGLLKFSKENGLIKAFPTTGDSLGPSHTYVYSLLTDSHRNFWLGTPTGGLNLFDRNRERFVHLSEASSTTGLSGNLILCIFQDSKGNIWVGTVSGLSKLITPLEPDLFSKTESGALSLAFRHYGREAGFPNEVIYGILEDENGLLWMSTNEGLVVFDPDAERVSEVFNRSDGCRSDEHNQNAFVRFRDGSMAFGGPYGLYHFHPDRLNTLPYAPRAVLTDVHVNKVGIKPVPGHLVLNYRQNDISFRFSALSYIKSAENKYRYRLKGFDEKWYERTANRLVTYTNLDPGTYEFEVQAANGTEVWSEEALLFNFTIGEPPWRAWYAYIAYALFLATSVLTTVKWRIAQVRREERRKLEIEEARSEEREIFRKRSARDFHDEAGNKITRINLLVELARDQASGSPAIAEYLTKIARNTAALSGGMRDFNWALDPEKDSLFDLLERIKIFGESMYEGENAHFELSGIREEFRNFKLNMELRRDLMMIFKEAINNAVKHSGASRCLLTVSEGRRDITLSLCDFGKGLSESADSGGYGLKNMQARARKHQIEMKISSDPDKGSCIVLKLPHMGGTGQA